MRRWVLVAAALVVAACGGSGSPTSPGPSSGVPLHSSSGFYTLTLTLRSDPAAVSCSTPLPVTRATLPVTLQRGDSDLTVQPLMMDASLRLRLQVSGDDRLISGTMFGGAIADEGVSIDVFGTTEHDPALVNGRADPTSVQGMIIGQLMLAGASCTSASYNWQLTPRPASRGE